MKEKFYIASEVTPLTLAVLPKETKNGRMGSHILEGKSEYFVKDPPKKVMDLACKFFGSTLSGRQIGTKEISNMTHKLPIAIDPTSGIYFFPTMSPTNPNCAWIAHSHINYIKEVENQRTKIVFKNNQSIIIDVSYGSVNNQINRTAQYRFKLDERVKRLLSYHRPRDPDEFI